MKPILLALALVAAGISGAEARTWRIEAGQSAQLADAFAQAQAEDVIRIERGRYELTQGLSLRAARVEVRGGGVDETILSFAGAGPGAGVSIEAARVHVEGLTIENATGDAISARECDGLSVRDLRARWTQSAQAQASGLNVSACANVLVERSAFENAGRAGILINGGRNIIVSENRTRGGGIGIGLANVAAADISANDVRGAEIGVAVFDTPALAAGGGIRLFTNVIADNNAPATEETLAGAPGGVGVLIMAARNVHVFDNDISNHGSTHVLVIAYPGPSGGNASFVPVARDVMIRNNRFGAGGQSPQGALVGLAPVLPDVIWDGADTYFGAGAPRTAIPRIVMRDNRSSRGGIGSFLSLGLSAAGTPFSEASPSPAFPPLVNLPEPERVRLD